MIIIKYFYIFKNINKVLYIDIAYIVNYQLIKS